MLSDDRRESGVESEQKRLELADFLVSGASGFTQESELREREAKKVEESRDGSVVQEAKAPHLVTDVLRWCLRKLEKVVGLERDR